MAKALSRRLRKLEKLFETEKPCVCAPSDPPVDWGEATNEEIRRFITLSKASELAVPRTCEHCGHKTIKADRSRLSKKDQVELQAIALAVRERVSEKAGRA